MAREAWLRAGMVAVVTGASSGIGRSIAQRLSEEGVVTACLSRTAEKVAPEGPAATGTPANVIAEAAGRLHPFACDVRDAESVRTAVERVIERFGRIDILVNAAGVSMPEFQDLESIESELWKRILDTNLTGVFNVTRCGMPHLKKSGGYLINILSTAAFRSIIGNAPYSASKYGARAVSETAALEGKEHGVRVASISPGPVNTEIWSHKTVPPDAEKKSRMLDPEDIADIALFMLKTPGRVVIDNVTVTPLNF